MPVKLLTSKQIAALLGTDPSTIRQMIRREGLEPEVRGGPGGKSALFDPWKTFRWICEERPPTDCIASLDIELNAEEWLAKHPRPAD